MQVKSDLYEIYEQDVETNMVEIGHDDLEAFSFFTDEVLHWHLDILKINPRSSRSPLSSHLHLLRSHSFGPRNQEDGDTLGITWLSRGSDGSRYGTGRIS